MEKIKKIIELLEDIENKSIVTNDDFDCELKKILTLTEDLLRKIIK